MDEMGTADEAAEVVVVEAGVGVDVAVVIAVNKRRSRLNDLHG